MKGPSLGQPLSRTVTEALLKAAAEDYGALTFVQRDERETSHRWSEVLQKSVEAGGALQRLGVRPGDRVAIVLPTGIAFVSTFFGAQLAGAIPVPLYPPVRLGRMDEYHASTAAMITAARARVLVTNGTIRRLMGEVTRLARPDLGCVAFEALEPGELREYAPMDDALALIQFSSGSTSAPKPVALSHRAVVHQLEILRTLMPDDARDNLGVSWLPLYHDMGLIGALLSAAYYPGPLVLLQPQDFLAKPALWLRAISRHRGTISPAPNFAYALCLKRVKDEELAGVDLSSWRYALNGAEPVSVNVMRKFSERFGRLGFREDALLPVYGMSEASLAVSFAPRDRPRRTARIDPRVLARDGVIQEGEREVASVGVPVPGFEVEVRSEEGGRIPDGKLGRIFVRGPSLMAGYDGQHEVTDRVLRSGWLDTGDLGFVRDGELFVFGRAKDVVILRGANHAPQEFEDALEGLQGVRPGCAVALGFLPDGGEEEALLLLVETTDDAPEDLESRIRGAVVERTNEKPHTVVLLAPGTLPRTSSGKLRRAEALRRYLAGELTAPKPVNVITVGGEIAKSAVGFLRARLP